LGDAYGVGAQIKQITAAVISGEIGFADALRQRMALMKGMERSLIEAVYENNITLQSGARTFIRTMAHHGAYCILVSGGFSFFTRRIAQRIGFDDHQGNELVFADDKLTGEVLEPILGRTAKLETMTRLCAEKGLDLGNVLAVGDGANDIKMIQAAGLGVAYHSPDIVRKEANASINHGDLTALLYMQGFHKSEFRDS
jgi:phosphoserine phosphatase